MSYLKNYTTKINASQTISEIEKILAINGAKGIMKEYDTEGTGIVKLIYFMIETKQGEITYKLPCDYRKIRQTLIDLKKQRKINITKPKAQSLENANNIGWRIIKDWLEAQLSLIRIEMTEFEQIFLPYAYDVRTNKTLYEKLKETNYQMLIEGNNNG